jgi:hypothetical protein
MPFVKCVIVDLMQINIWLFDLADITGRHGGILTNSLRNIDSPHVCELVGQRYYLLLANTLPEFYKRAVVPSIVIFVG